MKATCQTCIAFLLAFTVYVVSAAAETTEAELSAATRAAPAEVEAGRSAAQAVLRARRLVRENEDLKRLREEIASLQADLGMGMASDPNRPNGVQGPSAPTDWSEAKLKGQIRKLQEGIAKAESRARLGGAIREFMAPTLALARDLEADLDAALQQHGNGRIEKLDALRHRFRADGRAPQQPPGSGPTLNSQAQGAGGGRELPPTIRFSSDVPSEP